MTFPSLETSAFVAFIADNSSNGIHRAGYNGLASLIPRESGNNLFVPTYAGLNYETISLAGLEPYLHKYGAKFEPRSERMFIESADAQSVVLVQPETSHSHVSARITFTVEEPHYIHQEIELTFHRRFCPEDEPNRFRSLWASYMHQPPDKHIYSKPDLGTGPDLDQPSWYGITRTDHGTPEMQVKLLPKEEITAADHLAAMDERPPLTADELTALAQADWNPMALPKSLDSALTFYYGLCHDQIVLMMFKQPERFRLAYSPSGGGKQPAWNPAWDYVLALDDAPLEETCRWNLCLATKPFEGRADVLKEVRRYQAGGGLEHYH